MDKLYFAPCLHVDWPGFKMHYRYRESVYHITVTQTDAENGEMSVIVDGVELSDKVISLVDDHLEHIVEVRVQQKNK